MSEASGKHESHQFASTLESVDRAEEMVVQRARELGMNEDQQYEIGVAIREGMVNAVAHGNQYDAGKQVTLTVGTEGGSLLLVIEDEGQGLDLEKVADPTQEDNLLRASGRGLLIMKAFVDEFAVEHREPRGTRVRMVKHVTPV